MNFIVLLDFVDLWQPQVGMITHLRQFRSMSPTCGNKTFKFVENGKKQDV